MRLRLSLAAVVAAQVAFPAVAQEPDNATILRAIQGLAGRVDGLQKDVDKLKGRGNAPTKQPTAGQPAPAPAAATTTAKPNAKSIPGWLVSVVPGDDPSKDALGKFNAPASAINFGMHARAVPGSNEYAYAGEAFFHANGTGRYVFVIELDPISFKYGFGRSFFNCDARLYIADNLVVDAATKFEGFGNEQPNEKTGELVRPQTFSGGADLEEKDYRLKFQAGCWHINSPHGAQLESIKESWMHNGFKILVRGPDDNEARPFDNSELFHIGKARKL